MDECSDYTRVVATVCPDCGRREVFPPHGERPPRQTWWSDPEKTARQRRERKEKAQLDAERRLRRKERRRPKAEKKERRRMVRDNGDEEATSEIPQEDGAMDAGSEDERRLATNAHRSGEHEESDVSDHQAEEDEEGEPPELSGKVLTSQERLHVKLKEGRIVVQKSFVKGIACCCLFSSTQILMSCAIHYRSVPDVPRNELEVRWPVLELFALAGVPCPSSSCFRCTLLSWSIPFTLTGSHVDTEGHGREVKEQDEGCWQGQATGFQAGSQRRVVICTPSRHCFIILK